MLTPRFAFLRSTHAPPLRRLGQSLRRARCTPVSPHGLYCSTAPIKEEEVELTLLPPAAYPSQLQSSAGDDQLPTLHASSTSTTPVRDAIEQPQRQDCGAEGLTAMSGVSDFVNAAEDSAPLRTASLPALLPSNATSSWLAVLDRGSTIQAAPLRVHSMPPFRRPTSTEAFAATHPGTHSYRHSQAYVSPDKLAAHFASPFRLGTDSSRPLLLDGEAGRGPGLAWVGQSTQVPSAATSSPR